MCWTQPYTRYKTKTNKTKSQTQYVLDTTIHKTNKTKNTTQYVLDTTIHKTQDQDKQNKKHNTICVRHNHTQDTRPRQTKQKTQHNMCWTQHVGLVA